MSTTMMKAGFILLASAGFVLFNLSTKRNLRRLLKLLVKSRDKSQEDLYLGI